MATTIRELLASGPVLCDGAMGTELYARGIDYDRCFEELNVTRPDLVLGVHQAYVDAGAQVLETNTFGANRLRLDEHDLADKVREFNLRGVELARQAAGSARQASQGVLVAASVGPSGRTLAPLGRTQPAEAFAAFCEQIAALAEAGIDLIILETFSDLQEIEEAIRAARQEAPGVPLVACMTFAEDGHTALGHTPEQVARRFVELDVDVIGVNCSVGPAKLLPVAQQLLAHAAGRPVAALPNAGWPTRAGGRILYPSSPEYFAQYAQRFAEAGVTLIGGCCGTTPAHIEAMRRALSRPASPSVHSVHNHLQEEIAEPAAAPVQVTVAAHPTELALQLATGKFVISVEVDPPRSVDPSQVLNAARALKAAGATTINVADTPMARMRMSAWALSFLVQQKVGMETVLHFPTRGRNLLRIQGDLLAAHALGVRNIFVVMGDPPTIGDYPEANAACDVVPTGLLSLIKHKFNTGVDQAGASIQFPTSFVAGAALNFGAEDLDREIRLTRKKIEAGADFCLTQPVYDAQVARRFLARYAELYGPLELPVLVGLLPLVSVRHAEFLHNEVPGIELNDRTLERMRGAGERAAAEGVDIARELLLELREIKPVAGVYFMPPFGRYDVVADVLAVMRP